jgi:hypothetical protein
VFVRVSGVFDVAKEFIFPSLMLFSTIPTEAGAITLCALLQARIDAVAKKQKVGPCSLHFLETVGGSHAVIGNLCAI